MALTDEKKKVNNVSSDVVDINIEGATRQRFRINGDDTAIIELNVSDLGIIERLETGLKAIEQQMSKISGLDEDDENLSEKLKEADKAMREQVDFIFDYPVSAVCARYGTMYDPKDGKFRYETIIDGLLKLYTANINKEAAMIESRIKKHTDKYTSKGKKK